MARRRILPLLFLVVLVAGGPLVAQTNTTAETNVAPALSSPPPFVLDQAYSAEQSVTRRNGLTMTTKIYVDHGRARTELNVGGMNIIAIVLPDQKKAYSLMPAQHMVMELPYNAGLLKQYMAGVSGLDGAFAPAGIEMVNGISCTKYDITTKGGKLYVLWIDSAKKQPVKLAAGDGSFTALWTNYQPGPQPASLFQIPADYQVMQVPSAMPMPGDDMPGM